jgi:ribosomal protein S18 acetylase RimI-like enzyme
MPKLTVRGLDENDWSDYREVRLAALQEAPFAFVGSYEDEQQYDEAHWRSEVRSCRRLVLERDKRIVGVVSLKTLPDDPEGADVSGLWVAPEARHTGAAMRLVEAAAGLAAEEGRSKIYYWVGSENAAAIGFALNAGFLSTSRRRTAATQHPEFGDQEIAFVLSLAGDPAAIPNASPRSLRRTG